jgi:hypothetical protein
MVPPVVVDFVLWSVMRLQCVCRSGTFIELFDSLGYESDLNPQLSEQIRLHGGLGTGELNSFFYIRNHRPTCILHLNDLQNCGYPVDLVKSWPSPVKEEQDVLRTASASLRARLDARGRADVAAGIRREDE